ncbi:MAG: c-type cytochrome [Candidatus Anammoxibacter sp.]
MIRRINLSFLVFALIAINLIAYNGNRVFAERMIESPYGPVKPLDFNMYKEYYAGRSFIEYEGSEFGAGVVTDLVLSLTEENIRKKRGETTVRDKFVHFCSHCHGVNGNGEGKFVAAGITPKPANISDSGFMSALSDTHITSVITGGSQAVGKSNLCPPWGMTFDKVWISDMVAFVRTLSADKTVKVAQVATVAKTEETSAADDDSESNTVRWIILGFATVFFVGIAVLEWSWLIKKK